MYSKDNTKKTKKTAPAGMFDGESNSKKEEGPGLVKFSMGGGGDSLEFVDDGTRFNQFEHNKKAHGYKSTYKESYYTVEVDENKYTEKQKRRAAQLEREIEGKKWGKQNNYNEDNDEEMDTAEIDPSQNYDDFIKENQVMDIADIEAKQLSGKDVVNKEITQEDLLKKESTKSANDFEISEIKEEKPKENTSEGGDSTTNKSSMKLGSRAFTPKGAANKTPSTKSIDEFDISGGDATQKAPAPEAKKGGMKLKKDVKAFKPKTSLSLSGTRTFVPNKSALSSSTVTPPVAPLSTQKPPVPASNLGRSTTTKTSLNPNTSQSFIPNKSMLQSTTSRPYVPKTSQPPAPASQPQTYIPPAQTTFQPPQPYQAPQQNYPPTYPNSQTFSTPSSQSYSSGSMSNSSTGQSYTGSSQGYGKSYGQNWGNGQRKEEKKTFRYYKIEKVVDCADLFNFQTYYFPSKHEELVKKINDYKQQQMTTSAGNQGYHHGGQGGHGGHSNGQYQNMGNSYSKRNSYAQGIPQPRSNANNRVYARQRD